MKDIVEERKLNANENTTDFHHIVKIRESQENAQDFKVDVISYHFAPNPPKGKYVNYNIASMEGKYTSS